MILLGLIDTGEFIFGVRIEKKNGYFYRSMILQFENFSFSANILAQNNYYREQERKMMRKNMDADC